MRSTKVKALSVGGRRKVYYAGDTVSEDMFPKGDFDKLIEKGFLHPVGEDADDGKKPNFDQDDQPETRFGADIQTPGMISPAFKPQPQVQAGPVEPKKPTAPPVVPGTPGDSSVKVQNDETGNPEKAETTEADGSKLTVAQLKKDLTDRGIPYPSDAKKEDLLKLWARGE